jgi:hypothetical protein
MHAPSPRNRDRRPETGTTDGRNREKKQGQAMGPERSETGTGIYFRYLNGAEIEFLFLFRVANSGR